MTPKTKTKARIREIAEASGLSQATVSQVLGNGKRPVRAETRERIETAARCLGYHPNALARGLATRRMNTLGGVIQHDRQAAHTNPSLAEILDGILSAATRHRQHTNIVTYSGWAEAEASLPTLTDGRCDGVILVVPPPTTALVPALLERGLPFILVGTHSDSADVSYVDIDNVAAAEKIVSYLLTRGHRRIGFFSIPGSHQFVDERILGYRHALEKASIPFDPTLVITESCSYDDLMLFSTGVSACHPTALFCVTDADALSAMHYLMKHGVHIPEDLSIAGFDDIHAAALSFPPLTTLRQPNALSGERAAEILLAQINGKQAAGHKLCLPTELMIRSSVVGLQR
jgi:DNA-binding LacI/PurR family transcriptional regulator